MSSISSRLISILGSLFLYGSNVFICPGLYFFGFSSNSPLEFLIKSSPGTSSVACKLPDCTSVCASCLSVAGLTLTVFVPLFFAGSNFSVFDGVTGGIGSMSFNSTGSLPDLNLGWALIPCALGLLNVSVGYFTPRPGSPASGGLLSPVYSGVLTLGLTGKSGVPLSLPGSDH